MKVHHSSNESSAIAEAQWKELDAASLYSKPHIPTEYVVPQLLPVRHLTLLAGKPKSGKTWIALQLAMAVAMDRPFLGRTVTTPGRVLFCEFDDAEDQIQHRLRVLLPRLGTTEMRSLKALKLIYSVQIDRHSWIEKLDRKLGQSVGEGDPYRLVVLDPYLAFRTNGKKSDLIASDYEEISRLRALCSQHGCAALLVHHLRKGTSKYLADQILGSTGLTAAVDGWWVIVEDEHAPGHVHINVQGRSVPKTSFKIRFGFDGQERGIHLVDEGVHLAAGPAEGEVLRLLQMSGPMAPGAIAQAVGKEPNTIYQLLHRLRGRELVRKIGNDYVFPS